MRTAGHVAPGLEPVRAAFERNFDQNGEIGAAVCIHLDGDVVVDLWGGDADAEQGVAWRPDTLQCVFSSTKAMTGLAVAMLVDRGVLAYDEPIATWWPEFAQHGKERITLRQVLSHQAGLPVLDEPIARDQLGDLDLLAGVLARQAPVWEPGTRHGYGPFTVGFYPGEVVRRVEGRTIGSFVAEEIAAPLGAEFWIGLPPRHDERVSRVVGFDLAELDTTLPTFRAFADPGSLIARGMANPTGLFDFEFFNDPAFRRIELPAANGITTARSFSRIYAACAGGGELDGVRLLSEATLAEATRTAVRGVDEVYQTETAWALGFFNPAPGMEFSPSPRAFGHAGIGGSIGFADPDAGVGFAYAMNRLGTSPLLDPRPRALVDALYACVAPGVPRSSVP